MTTRTKQIIFGGIAATTTLTGYTKPPVDYWHWILLVAAIVTSVFNATKALDSNPNETSTTSVTVSPPTTGPIVVHDGTESHQ